MALKLVKYIKVDDNKGILYSGGKQSLLVPINFIKVLNSTFIRLVGKQGSEILTYKTGESIGKGYAQSLESLLEKENTKIDKKTEIKVSCNAIFMEAGWGRIKIKKIDLAKNFLEVEISHSPSSVFLKNSGYDLEKGILVGIYQEITKEKVYCKLINEDKKEYKIILMISKEIFKEVKEKEKIILLTRKNLERIISQKTKELEKKINELERFYKLTIDREIKMIKLKEEIKELRKEK